LSIDLNRAIRKCKPDKRIAPVTPRPQDQRPHLTALPGGQPLVLLLDTNIYIDRAAGRLPPGVRSVIDQALLFHCSVALAELATGVANADPLRRGWASLRDHYSALLASIPDSRLVTPDAQISTEAGVIAGTLARTQRYQPYQRKECLNDALIFLTAAKAGIPVLTANRDEFDLIQQIAPEGQFVSY